MQRIRFRIFAAFVAALVLTVGRAEPSWARQAHDHDGHDHGHAETNPEHGGTVAETDHYRFEVVTEADGLRVYPLGDALAPGVVDGLKGRAFFLLPEAKQFTKPYTLRPVASAEGQPADALELMADLSGLPTEGTNVTIQVWRMPDPAETTAEFTVPFSTVQAAEIVAVEATEADQLGIDVQATCPVSGDDLNAMGGPIKVTRGPDESLFLCCQGCLAEIEESPDRYFGSLISVSRATKADAEAVAAQGTCPISEGDLNAMGGPIKLSKGGESVFVCCPACIDAVKADAATYLGAGPDADPDGGHDHDLGDHDHEG